MFEKEAKEYTFEHRCKDCWMSGANVDGKCSGLDFCSRCKDWQKGAEFGYNKSNEWHFVKDGDLPKENQLVLLYRENPNGANVTLTHWYKSYVNDKVIAWKEVIPPKELDE